MTGLGNVFDAMDDNGGAPGPDLHTHIEVPSHAMGDPDGFAALVDPVLDGIARAESGPVQLHLPPSLPQGAVLRLRRQGGR